MLYHSIQPYQSNKTERSKNSRQLAGACICNLAADDIQHFAVGLHGLGQILHDLHILNTSELSVC